MNKYKRFGYHMDQLHFHLYDSRKNFYLHHKTHGPLEIPKTSKTKNIDKLAELYRQRVDYEKYMNPKGLKPTITSRFKRPPQEQEFVSHEVILQRSLRSYDRNTVCMRVDPFLSQPEIKQYLMKLYQMPVLSMHTVNKMGQIKRHSYANKYWRKRDWKKAIVKLEYDVDPRFQRLDA